MRKSGTSILQSFLEGPSLIAPQFVSHLRALAEYQQNDGLVATFLSKLGMGGSPRPSREDLSISHDALCMGVGLGQADRSKPFAFSDGVAVIPMHGALLHRDNYSDSYATGYDYIASRYRAALADPDVTHIVFDVNSGGGHVAGNFELADEIYAGRSIKPSMAIVDASGYSGAYSLSSATNRIVSMPSGGVGSIGVLMMHVSVEKFLEKHGIDVNLIHAGERKIDSYPFNDLSDAARERFQANVDKSYEKFVSLVARNRDMDAADVRATEAMTYDAEDALALGLIDEINTPAAALAAFRLGASASNTNPKQGANNMATDNNQVGGGNTTAAENTAVATAPAAAPAAAAAPVVATDPVAAERARIKSITTCEEAKGREALAAHLAHDTSMSVEDARKTLAVSPVAAAASAASPFAAAMDNTQNPNVGANGGGEGEEEVQTVSVGERIARNWSKETGIPLRDAKK
jgi:signal peptide peptidase SppA